MYGKSTASAGGAPQLVAGCRADESPPGVRSPYRSWPERRNLFRTAVNLKKYNKKQRVEKSPELADKPGSVTGAPGQCPGAIRRAAIHLGSPSPETSSGLPESGADHAIGFLFGLAPGGVCLATRVTTRAVRSYRTLSPLPRTLANPRRSALCCTFRKLTLPRRYLAPCPVEPGLSSRGAKRKLRPPAAAWPAP